MANFRTYLFKCWTLISAPIRRSIETIGLQRLRQGAPGLSPTRQIAFLLFLAAIGVGSFCYLVVAGEQYRSVASAYRHANVFRNVLAEYPNLPPRYQVEATERKAAFFLVLRTLGVVDADAGLDEFMRNRGLSLFWQRSMQPYEQTLDPFAAGANNATLPFIALIAAQLGDTSSTNASSPEAYWAAAGDVMAQLLADRRGLLPALDEELVGSRGVRHAPDLEAMARSWAQRSWTLSALRLSDTEAPPNEAVLARVFEIFRVNQKHRATRMLPGAPDAISPDDQEFFAFSVRLAQALLDRLHADRGVKDARFHEKVYAGVVQWALLVAFTWLSLLILYRTTALHSHGLAVRELDQGLKQLLAQHRDNWTEERLEQLRTIEQAKRHDTLSGPAKSIFNALQRSSLIRQQMRKVISHLEGSPTSVELEYINQDMGVVVAREENERWLMTWLARSLPALGFIGTVVGIALALMNADLIPRASSAASQAAAVTLVAGKLGVAFTTTLIALVLGLASSYVGDWQRKRENDILLKLEQCLMAISNPALRGL